MTAKQALFAIILIVLLIWGIIVMRNPYRTLLPSGPAEVASIQSQLDRLSEAERELVLGYLKRSGGDVLPASMADPDNPLTALTVGEAIELQREFLAKQAVIDAQVRARKAARDEALAPLRAALRIELVKRQILPRGEALKRPEQRGGAKVAIDDMQILVSTYRLTNASESAIESAIASVTIRKAHRERTDLGILAGCYITQHNPLASGESVEIECANTHKHAMKEDLAYVEMAEKDFVIEWEPQEIRFADGRELKFKE